MRQNYCFRKHLEELYFSVCWILMVLILWFLLLFVLHFFGSRNTLLSTDLCNNLERNEKLEMCIIVSEWMKHWTKLFIYDPVYFWADYKVKKHQTTILALEHQINSWEFNLICYEMKAQTDEQVHFSLFPFIFLVAADLIPAAIPGYHSPEHGTPIPSLVTYFLTDPYSYLFLMAIQWPIPPAIQEQQHQLCWLLHESSRAEHTSRLSFASSDCVFLAWTDSVMPNEILLTWHQAFQNPRKKGPVCAEN